MGRGLAVAGDDGPAVPQVFHLGFAGIDHRLSGESHARAQLGCAAAADEVGDLGFLMNHLPNTVPDKFPDDAEAVGLDPVLHGGGNIRHAVLSMNRYRRWLIRQSDA